MTEQIEFFIYGRAICPLCDEMKQELDRLMSGKSYKCHVINVDSDPALKQRFGARIPVLVSGGQELCESRLDKAVLLQYLEGLALSK